MTYLHDENELHERMNDSARHRKFSSNDLFPIDHGDTKAWEKFGIVFHEKVDTALMRVTLPIGWQFEPYDLLAYLKDDRGRIRGSVLHYSDTTACITMWTRFVIRVIDDHSYNMRIVSSQYPRPRVAVVQDAGVEIWRTHIVITYGYSEGIDIDHQLYQLCENWLIERGYSIDRENPSLYWDEIK